jgi:hypothetical protein
MNEEETLGLPDQDLIDEIRQDEAAQADLLEAQQEQMADQPDNAPRFDKLPKEATSQSDDEEEGKNLLQDVGDYAGKAFKNWSEANMAPAAGTIDFAVDTINMVANTNIPKFRPFETEYAQASREIASFVIPNIALAQAGTAGAVGLQSKVGWGIGNTKLMKLFGNAGIDIGTGVAVDYVNAYSQEGDNLTGTLKKMFPKTYGWISNDWATLDSDSPEVKRAKSISEGAGMGVLSSLLEASGAFLRAANKTEQLTKLVPGNESSKAYFKELERAKYDNKVPEEVFENSVKSQEGALNEIGAYNLSKATDLDQPMLGVHDAFTEAESGVRTVDPGGVIGAAVDAVRIADNVDTTYGRLGSIVTESALKFGLQADQLPKRTIVKAIVDNLKKGGNFAANVNGKYLSPEQIYKRGEELSEILLDPRMETGMLKATLDAFKDVTTEAGKKLNQTGYAAVMNTIKGYLDEYVNMDAIRASAYFTTSTAGQISDMAEGARYVDGSEAVERAQEMILDRLEYLMVEKGVAAHYWGSSLNLLNTWKRFSNDPTILAKSGGNPLEQTDEALSNIVDRSKESIDSLRYIAQERPEFLKPLQLAWEFSDGNIDTLYKLQNFIHESLPNVRKAFLDFQPEIPNQIMQGVWSNIYNSVLSATTTPARAAAGNLGGIIAKPITTFAGAAISRDMKTMRRAAYQYFALADTFGKAMHHMAFVFSKASRDPSSVSYIVRDDLVRKNEETMKLLKSSAEAYANEGEMAPMLLYNVAETLQDLGNHPWLRYGANAMTALDGFTRSVLASAEARGQVFDEVLSRGGLVPTKKALKDAADKHYYKMFDTKGMIQNSAVENASRELALNLDTENVKIMSNLVSRVPALRAFIMFPRTSDNVIQMFDKYSPYSAFTEQVNELAYVNLDEMSRIDVKAIAQKYGIPDDEHMYTKVAQLKAETLGRKAVGTAAILGAGFLITQDRIHGRGHYDREVQRARGKDWLPQSIQGFDGRWYSYAELGPVGDWLSFTADIFDNADTLDELTVETLMRKSMFVFGGALTNRSMFAGIEPLFDVLTGNPGAIRRWTASFGSSLAPYSGLRNQLGKLLSPGMRELENDLADAMQNRNRLVDVINPSGALPKAYDWVDGREVGNMGFWTNAWNALMPMKVADGMSPEREFLIDIEYDARPTFHKSSKGVEYTAAERSELFRVMGESRIFRDRLRFIMDQKPAKEFRRQIHELRLGHREKVDQKLWNSVHKDVTNAMRAAQKAAEMTSDFQAVIRQTQFQKGINDVLQQQGRVPFFEWQNR